jgi:drug/metabolite transporter (DMT)-like permease
VPRAYAVAAAILFSTGGAGIKVDAFSGPEIVVVRSGVAAVAVLLWLRTGFRPSRQALGLGAVYAVMIALFVNATKLTTAANAIFLQSVAPVYVLLLAPRVLGEPFRRLYGVSVALAACGTLLCLMAQPTASRTAPDPVAGNLLGALCGLAWAITLLGLRRVERDHPGAGIGISAVVIGNVLASLASLPAAWPFPSASWGEWTTVLYLGVFQIGLAYLCLTRAMRGLPALEASLILLLEPVLNPLWTWLLWGESPGVWVVAGGLFIVSAAASKSWIDARAGVTPLPPRAVPSGAPPGGTPDGA